MPIYEYRCTKCGHLFDHLARRHDDAAKRCPKCGAPKPVKQFSAFSTAADSAGGASCSTGACSTGACPTGTCPLG